MLVLTATHQPPFFTDGSPHAIDKLHKSWVGGEGAAAQPVLPTVVVSSLERCCTACPAPYSLLGAACMSSLHPSFGCWALSGA